MGIRLHIRASEVEATANAWGLAGYTVEPFNAKLWGCNPDWVMTDVMLVMGEGRVVGLRERNMHDDSDFFVTYQTDAGVFVEREYATTRGWSYPNEARVDAPEDVQERYRAALRAAARYARAVRMLDVRAKRRERLRAASIVLRDYLKLRRAVGVAGAELLTDMLGQKRLRSTFKLRILEQTRAWLLADVPQYPTPITRRQGAALDLSW